ncbi:MAG: hypothetical protein RLZ98_865 [Pseudomonadota bacterium]|jgi:tripartite-type tricarboxylate transporter receptor subunit TctC
MPGTGWGRQALRWLSVCSAALVLQSAAAVGDEVADFYKGKRLKVMVGYGPGGTYDLYGRTLAKYIVEHVPGKPTYVTMNMPGASSAKLGNYFASAAPRDGTEFGIVNPSLLITPVLYEKSTLAFNPADLAVIGSVAKSSMLLVAWHTSGVKTVEDLRQKELIVAATSRTGDTFLLPQAMKTVLGLDKLKIITGYPGTREVLIALERAEVTGRVWNYDSIKATRPEWLAEGKLNVVAQLSIERDKDFPKVPLATDFTKSAEEKDALEIVFMSSEFSRPFVAPPGIPADRLKALRSAFDATMRDPAFVADITTQRLELSPLNAAQMGALLNKAHRAPRSVVQRVRSAIGG